MACWKQIYPAGARNRGLLLLIRRHRHNLSAALQDRLGGLSATTPGSGGHLPLQTAPLQLAAGESSEPETLPPLGPPLPARHRRTPWLRLRATGSTRQYLAFLARRNRHHVALHPQQRYHRGLSHQDEGPPTSGLWLSQLQPLQIES